MDGGADGYTSTAGPVTRRTSRRTRGRILAAPAVVRRAPLGGSPAASRRLRLGNNTPRLGAVARQFAHTPRGYRAGPVPRRPERSRRGGAAGTRRRRPPREPVARLTLVRGRPYHPPATNTRRRALWRSARLRASRGRSFRVPEAGWRGSRTVPMGKADLPAQEAPPRQGARVPRPHEDGGRTARSRRLGARGAGSACRPDRRARSELAAARHALPPAATSPGCRREASPGRTRCSSGGSCGPTLTRPGSGSRPASGSEGPWSGTASGAGSGRRSG